MPIQNDQRNVLIAGASGLVGSALLEMLFAQITIGKVIVLARKSLPIAHPKLIIVEVDFDNPDSFSEIFKDIQIVFCCVGTTMKIAGSKEAFRKVDYAIPVNLARLASAAGVAKMIVISSLGADKNSSNFYLKTKGEMEDAVSTFPFRKIAFLRPSVLLGPRKENRIGEKMAQVFLRSISFMLVGRLKKYRPIESRMVAKAMLMISLSITNQRIYEYNDLYWLGK
jgi:uncharacterized protein YbjT (DUF2867 family)